MTAIEDFHKAIIDVNEQDEREYGDGVKEITFDDKQHVMEPIAETRASLVIDKDDSLETDNVHM